MCTPLHLTGINSAKVIFKKIYLETESSKTFWVGTYQKIFPNFYGCCSSFHQSGGQYREFEEEGDIAVAVLIDDWFKEERKEDEDGKKIEKSICDYNFLENHRVFNSPKNKNVFTAIVHFPWKRKKKMGVQRPLGFVLEFFFSLK